MDREPWETGRSAHVSPVAKYTQTEKIPFAKMTKLSLRLLWFPKWLKFAIIAKVPEVSEVPEVSGMPEVSEVSEVSGVSEVPEVPLFRRPR